MNNQFVQIALVVALCSNAVLFSVLLVSWSNRGDFNKCEGGGCKRPPSRTEVDSDVGKWIVSRIRREEDVRVGQISSKYEQELLKQVLKSVVDAVTLTTSRTSPSTSTTTTPENGVEVNDITRSNMEAGKKMSSQQQSTDETIQQFYLKYFKDNNSLWKRTGSGDFTDYSDLFKFDLMALRSTRHQLMQQMLQQFHGDKDLMFGEDNDLMVDAENGWESVPSSHFKRSKRSRRSDIIPEDEEKTTPYRKHTVKPRHAPTTLSKNTKRPKQVLATESKQKTRSKEQGRETINKHSIFKAGHEIKTGNKLNTTIAKSSLPKHKTTISNNRKTTKAKYKLITANSRSTARPNHASAEVISRSTARPNHASAEVISRSTARPNQLKHDVTRKAHVTEPAKRTWRRRKQQGVKGYNRFNERAMRRANRIARRRLSKGKGFINKRIRETNGLKKIFATLPDHQVSQMSDMMTKVVLPSLVQFENLVGSHITGMRSALINQELRLERLEHASLEMQTRFKSPKPKDLQSDAEDNKTTEEGEDKIKDDVDDTDMTSSDSNITIRVQVFGKDDGSGEGEELDYQPVFASASTKKPTSTTSTTTEPPTTTTTTTTTEAPTTTEPPTTMTTTTTTTTTLSTKPTTNHPDANYEQLFRYYNSLSQKVDALQNYNLLSSTEFNRARELVAKMDDKVTELNRIHKNLKTRTSIHTHQLAELERHNSRVEASVRTALNTFERIGERFDEFREDMETFQNNIHKVNAQFATYEQISTELRAADAYKAHDILDVRESVMNVENRVNGMYRVLDEGNVNIRYEMADMLKRVCTINKLVC